MTPTYSQLFVSDSQVTVGSFFKKPSGFLAAMSLPNGSQEELGVFPTMREGAEAVVAKISGPGDPLFRWRGKAKFWLVPGKDRFGNGEGWLVLAKFVDRVEDTGVVFETKEEALVAVGEDCVVSA